MLVTFAWLPPKSLTESLKGRKVYSGAQLWRVTVYTAGKAWWGIPQSVVAGPKSRGCSYGNRPGRRKQLGQRPDCTFQRPAPGNLRPWARPHLLKVPQLLHIASPAGSTHSKQDSVGAISDSNLNTHPLGACTRVYVGAGLNVRVVR